MNLRYILVVTAVIGIAAAAVFQRNVTTLTEQNNPDYIAIDHLADVQTGVAIAKVIEHHMSPHQTLAMVAEQYGVSEDMIRTQNQLAPIAQSGVSSGYGTVQVPIVIVGDINAGTLALSPLPSAWPQTRGEWRAAYGLTVYANEQENPAHPFVLSRTIASLDFANAHAQEWSGREQRARFITATVAHYLELDIHAYTVKSNETLYGIERKFDTDTEVLQILNGIPWARGLGNNQTIYVIPGLKMKHIPLVMEALGYSVEGDPLYVSKDVLEQSFDSELGLVEPITGWAYGYDPYKRIARATDVLGMLQSYEGPDAWWKNSNCSFDDCIKAFILYYEGLSIYGSGSVVSQKKARIINTDFKAGINNPIKLARYTTFFDPKLGEVRNQVQFSHIDWAKWTQFEQDIQKNGYTLEKIIAHLNNPANQEIENSETHFWSSAEGYVPQNCGTRCRSQSSFALPGVSGGRYYFGTRTQFEAAMQQR